jgi:transaldolase
MSTGLRSLIESGTKVWLDSIDPEFIQINRALGATGATSNPIIVADLIKSGRFDKELKNFLKKGLTDAEIGWALTDMLVCKAQEVFRPVHEATHGDDGYVSFELDPLLEDPERNLPHSERAAQYVALGKQWSQGHTNRMIKVPATPAGFDAMEELAAAGVTLNVTLIFTENQYRRAREAVWRGAQKRSSLDGFKSVYSIFVSRVDVYTAKHLPNLSAQAQGFVGIVIAKRAWKENVDFWASRNLRLKQEIIFASTGVKNLKDDPTKYAVAFAGSDIETNPPATNEAVEKSGRSISREVDILPPPEVVHEIDHSVDMKKLEEALMREGIVKFAEPQKALLSLIAEMRAALAPKVAHG